MKSDFNERLDKILGRVTADDFLHGKGLGNEIPFYAFDYPPERELEVRDHITFLLAQSPNTGRSCGSNTSTCSTWSSAT